MSPGIDLQRCQYVLDGVGDEGDATVGLYSGDEILLLWTDATAWFLDFDGNEGTRGGTRDDVADTFFTVGVEDWFTVSDCAPRGVVFEADIFLYS